MATLNIELNCRPGKNNLYRLFLRMYENGKTKKILIKDVEIKKTDFNKRAFQNNWVRSTNSSYGFYNDKIQKVIEESRKIYSVGISKNDFFFEFAYSFIKKYDTERSKGTYDMYLGKLNKLREYIGQDWQKTKFKDITVAFLREYETHLIINGKSMNKGKKGNSINTVAVDLKKIKAIINQAIREDIYPEDKNPFRKIRIKTTPSKKEWLSHDEIKLFRNVDGLSELEKEVRDIFLFCLFCWGMRIGDALVRKVSDVNGKMLHYMMSKNNKYKKIKLTTEAVVIVKKYSENKNHEDYIFNFIDKTKTGKDLHDNISSKEALINKYLKSIAIKAGINKHLTSHIARHSWAQLALDNELNPILIQNMLDHESFNTTRAYLHGFNNGQADEANERMFRKKI